MAEPTQSPGDKPPNYREEGEQWMLGATEPVVLQRVGKNVAGWVLESLASVLEFILKNAGRIVVFMATALARGEDKADPIFRELTDAAVRDLTGAEPRGGHASVGKQILNAMTGGAGAPAGGNLQPSTAGAEAYMETVMKLALEGYLEGSLFHALSLGYLEKFGELDDILANVLGVGRASRAVMRPILNARVITPTTWAVNLSYRPQLLAAGEVARQVTRGRWTRERGIEELARQGYSDERIEALFNAAAKFHSAADLNLLVRAGVKGQTDAEQHLRDQGYAADVAKNELLLEQIKGIASFERAMAGAAVDAFVAGRISEGELAGFATGSTIDSQEKAQYIELAAARRALASRPLSSSEAEQCVKAKILSYSDYRAALRRENRTEDAIAALELLLRYELDKAKSAEEHRRELETERALEKKARLDAAAARKAEVEAARALERRGRRADLERAAVLGLVPLSRVAELYAATYDQETAAVLLELLEGDRLAYLAQQAARAEAAKRGAVRGVDIGALEAAVIAGVLSQGEYRSRLAELGFPAGDVALLADTLAEKIADKAAADEQRADAAAAAKVKKVSLSTVETLVRRGHRSMAEYDALLVSLGFDDAARAYMRELLQVQIDDDAKARAEREAAENTLKTRGLSLEQFRRGVLLGLTTIDAFQTFLVEQRFTPAAAQLLVAELRADVAEADTARQRRKAAEDARDRRDAPLSDVARAARLGLITVAAYQSRLERSGYSPDDVALEIDLLVHELEEIATARKGRAEAELAARNKGLSLTDSARAVRAGVASLASYTATVRAAGFSEAAATMLTRLLEDELATRDAARARREAIEAEGTTRRLSLAQLASAVKARLRSVEDYYVAIRGLGYEDEDAALLVGLLERELAPVVIAETRDDEIALEQPQAHATLGQLQQAVKDGLITMADYVGELRARGYGEAPLLTLDEDGRAVLDEESDGPYDDTELLALLLQVQLDAAATKGAS